MTDRVTQIFAEVLCIDAAAITDATSPENTPQWDSLAAMTLASAIEDGFAVQLTTGEIMRMRSIGLVKEVLRSKGITDV